MMTLEKAEGLTPEGLMSVRDRPLEDAYESHDLGHDLLTARLEAHGFDWEDHGDDARHADEVFYGDGPDVAVYDGGELVAYIELKTKESEEWFARCNLRHFREYVNFANETDVPVFIWFALVDMEREMIRRDAFFQVEDTDQIDGEVHEVSDQEVVFYEEDIFEVNEQGLLAVDADDLVGIRNGQEVVDTIPSVHGNEVVCLNEDKLRSFPHVLHIVAN